MPNWRTGAPAGNRNALKHGRYTAERRAAAREVTVVLRRARMHIAMAEAFLAQERALKRLFPKTTSAEFRQKSARLQHEDLPPPLREGANSSANRARIWGRGSVT